MSRHIYRAVRSGLLHYLIPQSRQQIFSHGRKGVEVVGLFHSASGIGESARLCARQLQENGIPVLCTSVEDYFRKERSVAWDFKDKAEPGDVGCRIIHLNPPMIPPYAFLGGLKNFSSVYNIGYWVWELEQLPQEWVRATRYMNAIMTPSEFSNNAISEHTSKPVLVVPHPVVKGAASSGIRQKLGIDESDFLVSMVFAYGSSIERKNPQAAIHAFKQAFSETDRARLVIKLDKIEDNAIGKALRDIAAQDARITFIEEIWNKEDVNALIAESNVYLSLHRSEGFGLTLAEAMLAGTSVVATNWSGNFDFCTAENSFPVSYSLVKVESTHAAFKEVKNCVWAEADTSDAAKILRSIYNDPEVAKKKSEFCLSETNKYFNNTKYVTTLKELSQ